VAWLLDHSPPEYRGYPVLLRHPVVLARCTAWHVAGALEACRQGLARVRVDLAEVVEPRVVAATVEVLERDQVALLQRQRAVRLVEAALRADAAAADARA